MASKSSRLSRRQVLEVHMCLAAIASRQRMFEAPGTSNAFSAIIDWWSEASKTERSSAESTLGSCEEF